MDFIDAFKEYSIGIPSCDLYREWCGLALLAAALERRVWANTGRLTTVPNLSVMLVGPPSAGKGVINTARDLIREVKTSDGDPMFNLSRKSYSKASLMDDMKDCKKVYIPADGRPHITHPLFMCAEEFTSMFPRFDLDFMAALTDLWNADTEYSERRRTGDVRSLSLEFPIITTLIGYQPAVMASVLPQSAWDQGFMRRNIMVWNQSAEVISLFNTPEVPEAEHLRLVQRLTTIGKLYGGVKWEQSAADMVDKWHTDGGPPRPGHTRLQSYCGTRSHILVKLCILASVSEDSSLVIRLRHSERALEWLLRVEALMPDVFRAMTGDSDGAVMTELHNAMIRLYAQCRPNPIPGAKIFGFLRDRVPSTKIRFIVETMEKSEMIIREPGTDLWRPGIGVSRAE